MAELLVTTVRDKDNMSLQVKKLKTKSLSRTGENKEETASKVKVLREKQSQWMKEREASKTATKKLKSVNKDNSTLPDVPKFRTRSAMSGSSSENAANRNPHSNPRRKPLYPEPQRDRTTLMRYRGYSKSDNPLVKRPPSATGSHKRNPSSSRMKASNDTQLKTNQEYVPSDYENPSSASVSKKLLSSSKQTLHNKLRTVPTN